MLNDTWNWLSSDVSWFQLETRFIKNVPSCGYQATIKTTEEMAGYKLDLCNTALENTLCCQNMFTFCWVCENEPAVLDASLTRSETRPPAQILKDPLAKCYQTRFRPDQWPDKDVMKCFISVDNIQGNKYLRLKLRFYRSYFQIYRWMRFQMFHLVDITLIMSWWLINDLFTAL